MKLYSIYKVTNKINEKCYIGFDSNWPRRKNSHKRNFEISNSKFYSAIKKYGWENFEWQVLYQSRDGTHCLNVMESYFIEQYDSFKNGYNMTLGGEGTLGYTHTNEQLLKNKAMNSGANHPNYGKKLSENTKKKISEKNSGKNNGMYGKKVIIAEKHREKISQALKGIHKTEKHKEKIKLAKLKSNYIMSEETKSKIAKSKYKKVTVKGLDFDSLIEASKYYDVHYTTISRWIKKERKC